MTAARLFRRERSSGQCDPVGHALEERSLLTRDARSLLRQALIAQGLSGRAYVRIIDLARTIADLDNLLLVGPDHVAEALALRLDHRRVEFV